MVEVDAGAEEALHLDAAALIVADGADVLGAQPQAGAGDHGAGHLPAGLTISSGRAPCRHRREMGHHQQRIGGVQAHAYDVEFRHEGLL